MLQLLIPIQFIFLSTSANAEKVKSEGMQGYFVYQDSNGNKYIKHPTVPSVAYDLNGKQLKEVPTGELKVGTVKSDGSIAPIGENGGGLFGSLSLILFAVIVATALLATWKVHKRNIFKREDKAALDRLKANLVDEASSLFVKYQKNYRPSQIEYIGENTTPNFFASVKDSIQNASDFKEVYIKFLKSDVQSVNRVNGIITAEVLFDSMLQVVVDEKAQEIKSRELWKFNMVDGKWLLAETKELNPSVVRDIAMQASKEAMMDFDKETNRKYNI